MTNSTIGVSRWWSRLGRVTGILGLLVLGLLVAGARAPSGPESVADSVRDFSGQQGAGGWYYGYWARSTDTDDRYAPAADFELLPHFGRDPVNRLSGHEEFTTGPLWNLEDGRYYTSLWAEGGHPHAAMNWGRYEAVEQWAVRRWVSAVEGPVTVRGHVGKVMPWGENWSGSVRTEIVVDGETVFSDEVDDGGRDYSVDVVLDLGSLVDFLIGPGTAFGVVDFTATIQESPVASR